MKDSIFATILYQIATVTSITTSYDNEFNRPESITDIKTYPCRIARKSGAYPYNSGAANTLELEFRCYFEIDAVIASGATIEVDGEKYKAGLVYKPMNHHTEVDLISNKES